jgi:hypothetical protein
MPSSGSSCGSRERDSDDLQHLRPRGSPVSACLLSQSSRSRRRPAFRASIVRFRLRWLGCLFGPHWPSSSAAPALVCAQTGPGHRGHPGAALGTQPARGSRRRLCLCMERLPSLRVFSRSPAFSRSVISFTLRWLGSLFVTHWPRSSAAGSPFSVTVMSASTMRGSSARCFLTSTAPWCFSKEHHS